MTSRLRAIAKRQDGVALIFFSGFGVQSNRETYLLPVDAQIWVEGDVVRDGFNLETILEQMNSHGATIKVALLDASRRNPFERRFRRSSAGLAPAVTPINTLAPGLSLQIRPKIQAAPIETAIVTTMTRNARHPIAVAFERLRLAPVRTIEIGIARRTTSLIP